MRSVSVRLPSASSQGGVGVGGFSGVGGVEAGVDEVRKWREVGEIGAMKVGFTSVARLIRVIRVGVARLAERDEACGRVCVCGGVRESGK
jgi:hypothetical protein